MKSLMIRKNKAKLLFLSLFLLIASFFVNLSLISAADIKITARIPDTQAPSVPILIAPPDDSLLNNNTPSFSWYESTDNVGMSHYVLYLNGGVFYNNIPLISTDNSYYTLIYDPLNSIYTLTPKNPLSDRSYTWNIVAFDYANLSSSSDVWDFTIDTLAPNFRLTKIGDTTVDISAGNVGSVPNDPIIIFKNDATANEPVLVAYGEANSEVKLTVTIPDDATQIFTKQIDANSYYELKLGILPRNKDIRLDFIITDRVGHVSVLEKVYFRIELQYWPTATPTPTSTLTPTPTTSVSPTPIQSISPTLSVTTTVKPSATVSPTPIISISPLPTGIIPIIPPKEIIHEISDEIIEVLPESTAEQIRTFLRSELWGNLAPLMGFIFLLIFYLFAFFLLLSKFIRDFSVSLLKKIVLILFPNWFKATKNLVFDYRETIASPLVKVELLDKHKQVLDFTITNLRGNFNDFDLPSEWSLRVTDGNFYYPIGDQKPMQLDFWHFYQGQAFNQENYYGQAILIPTLRAAGQERLPFFERVRIFVLYLLEYPWWFLVAMLLFSLIFALRYENIYNLLALIFYLIILLTKLIDVFKQQKSLVLSANQGVEQKFTDNLIVSIFDAVQKNAISFVASFDFSKTSPIKHNFKQISITGFAKHLAIEKEGLVIAKQDFALSKRLEEISLQIKKT